MTRTLSLRILSWLCLVQMTLISLYSMYYITATYTKYYKDVSMKVVRKSAKITMKYEKVAFLKVHKTGSSTAQNIFLRYGYSRNLMFVLPKVRKGHYDNVISQGTSLNEDNIVPSSKNKTFDILCCHVLYNRKAFQKYVPGKTAYIGIVREPFEQFLSTLKYFRPPHIFKNIKELNPVLKYLQNPMKYEKAYSYTNNRMAFEFDFPRHLFTNYTRKESQAYLSKIDNEFHFVIIMDYFMESIVMMRRILGWNVKDVLFLKKNSAKKYWFIGHRYRNLYERFAKLDYDLYNFFYRRLWEQIRLEGINFQLELKYFKNLRQEVEDYCVKEVTMENPYLVPVSLWNVAFNVTSVDCTLLMMGEPDFVSLVRKRQSKNDSKRR
ncbi:galactose-3-O-sulfotransferase 2-like [Mytilus edulis]|uniref:galactose-3-O-sulfotransferase 2-like n=1 Tax=Mytilus edulis TaxID=6550 RepID=UPI0039EE6563